MSAPIETRHREAADALRAEVARLTAERDEARDIAIGVAAPWMGGRLAGRWERDWDVAFERSEAMARELKAAVFPALLTKETPPCK